MNIAVIPARGGSKRIARKNIRVFAGRPIIGWSIDAALASDLFDRVIVSTDDEEIAQTASAHGAEVPFIRPEALSGDHTGTLEVIQHAANLLAERGVSPDLICCIYATAAFVNPADLAGARSLLMDSGFNYVFAAARLPASVLRSFQRAQDGSMQLNFPQYRLSRSQDLPPVYHDAGQFYWGRASAWREGRPIFGARTGFVELPQSRVQDIDTEEDWVTAERMFQEMRAGDEI